MADPQAILDNAYPSALEGSAVIDEVSGDYWIKKNGIWINYGPTLGETINLGQDITPWSETIILDGAVRTSLAIETFPYPLYTETSVTLTSAISFETGRVYSVPVPVATVALTAFAPARNLSKHIFAPTTSLAIVAFAPQDIKASLSVLNASVVTIQGRTPTVVAWAPIYTGTITIVPGIPRVEIDILVLVKTIQVIGHPPQEVGDILIAPVAQISVIARVPTIKQSVPTAYVQLIATTPGISPKSIRVPVSKTVEIKANIPDNGKGLVAGTTLISVRGIAPTIDGFTQIDPLAHWNMWHVTWDEKIFYQNTDLNVPAVNVYGYLQVVGVGTGGNGSRSTTQKKFGDYSGIFNTTNSNVVYLRTNIEEVDTTYYPWCKDTEILPSTFDIGGAYNWTGGSGRQYDFYFQAWVYPASTSFTGIDDTHNRPIATNHNFIMLNTGSAAFSRGWELFYRGSSTGTVIARWTANAQSLTTEVELQGGAQLPANTWSHVAFARKGNYYGIAVNGVWGAILNTTSIPYAPQYRISSYPYSRFSAINLGRFVPTNSTAGTYFAYDQNRFTGHLDDLKLIKGKGVDYVLTETAPGTWSNFTPPASSTASSLERRPQSTGNVWLYPDSNFQATGYDYTVVSSFYEREMWEWFYTVEQQDAQDLEPAVKLAVNRFILRLKKDNLWISLTDCYLFIGARTFSGAINIALKGSPPTEWHAANSVSTGFGISDYNRELGLKGDGVSKFIRTDRVANSFNSSNHHRAAWVTSVGTGPIFSSGYSQSGATYVDWIPGYGGVRHGFGTNSLALSGEDAISSSGGFVGFSRSSENSYQYLVPGAEGTRTASVQQPYLEPVEILAASVDQASNWQRISYGSHRLSFYSHGAAIDLKQLRMRVQMLMNELNAAIV